MTTQRTWISAMKQPNYGCLLNVPERTGSTVSLLTTVPEDLLPYPERLVGTASHAEDSASKSSLLEPVLRGHVTRIEAMLFRRPRRLVTVPVGRSTRCLGGSVREPSDRTCRIGSLEYCPSRYGLVWIGACLLEAHYCPVRTGFLLSLVLSSRTCPLHARYACTSFVPLI